MALRGIQYFDSSPVRFEANGHTLYGTSVCAGEVAPGFCQPVKPLDRTNFQVKPCDFSTVEKVLNNDFSTDFDWNLGIGTTINTASNRAEHAGSIGSIMSQDLNVQNNRTYQVRFTVNNFADGGSGNDLLVRIGGNVVETVNASTTPFSNQAFLVDVHVVGKTNTLLEIEWEDNVTSYISDVSVIEAECELTQLITNPEFPDLSGWTNTSGNWSASSQQATISRLNSGVLSQDIGAKGGTLYRVEIEISGIDAASAGNMELKIGSKIIDTYDSGTTTGLKTYYYYLTEARNRSIELDASSMGISIEYITIYELSAISMSVLDCNGIGQQQHKMDSASIADFDIVDSSSYINVEYNWILSDGCYQLCIYDVSQEGSELILNGDFASGASWSFGGITPNEWAWSGSTALHIGTGVNELKQVSAIGLADNSLYRVEFELSNFNAGSIDIDLGGANFKTIGSGASNEGLYSLLVATSTITVDNIVFKSVSGTTEVDVDNVSVKLVGGQGATGVCSECFQSGSWLDAKGCDRTLLLTASNHENGFGQNYVDFPGYEQRMRVFGRLKRESWTQTEYDTYLFNTNSYTTNYAQSRENKTMILGQHPAYVYNALQLMSDHDVFEVDGTQYHKETEGIQPDWAPRKLTASAEMTIFKTSQPNRINDNC